MLTFTSAFASNFNIVSVAILMLMQRIATEPILCILHFVTIASVIFETANADFDAKCE